MTVAGTEAITELWAKVKLYADGAGGGVSTYYGTCSTPTGTAVKAVTCAGFELEAGAVIGILFSTANTAATPKLNVNSTGEKSLYVGNTVPNSTTNALKWSANTMLFVMYDGANYRYLGAQAAGTLTTPSGAGAWFGTSSTGATVAAKATTVTNFRLMPGAVVAVAFSTANTVSGAITLNVNSTGAKTVYRNNAATSASNALAWNGGDVLLFAYSGSYWHYVGGSSSGSGGGSSTYRTVGDFPAS